MYFISNDNELIINIEKAFFRAFFPISAIFLYNELVFSKEKNKKYTLIITYIIFGMIIFLLCACTYSSDKNNYKLVSVNGRESLYVKENKMYVVVSKKIKTCKHLN